MNKKELVLTDLLFIYNLSCMCWCVSFYIHSKPAQVLRPGSFVLDLPILLMLIVPILTALHVEFLSPAQLQTKVEDCIY